MSRSLCKVLLIGNVGNEPEIKSTASGKKLAKLSLATSRSFNDRNGTKQEKTEWHRVTFWDKLVDVVERYVHKGDRLYVEGRIEYGTSEDANGVVKYFTDIVAQELVMLGGSGERQAVAAPAAGSPFDDESDGLPF